MSTEHEWKSDAATVLASLVAVLDACQNACINQFESVLISEADQLRAASRHFQLWLELHPGPNPDLRLQLIRVSRSVAYLATSLEVLARSSPNVSWRVAQRELTGLQLMIVETHSMMSDRHGRERQRSRPESAPGGG